MQLAGALCGICRANILVTGDATWCASCATVFHRNCLARVDTICPTCRRSYERPEPHFAFSQYCPECMRPNEPPQEQCASCGAGTRWDTRADYERFVAYMKATARRRLLRGLAELGGAAACLAALLCGLSVHYTVI